MLIAVEGRPGVGRCTETHLDPHTFGCI